MKLRWYQNEAVDVSLEKIQDPDCHPILAIPTGAGKTIIGTTISIKFIAKYKKDILFLSHVKEILQQNYKSLTESFDEEIGLFSAGLKSRTIKRVTVAGIQSIHKKPHLFQNVGLVIIDECHLVNDLDVGMYRDFLREIKNANFIGLTASPFRARGMLHKAKNGLFTEIAYNLTDHKNFSRLIEEKYLTTLYSKSTELEMNVKGVRTVAGDFKLSDLDIAFNQDFVTDKALEETLIFGKKYKKWLIFAINIDHAESISKKLNELGILTKAVHSKMSDDRDQIIEDFRKGKYRALVNVNILTTGIDIPEIDLIVMLRPTKSPIIYVQSVGRGLRVAPNKDHCLVLDFAGNTERLGPIDSIDIREKGEPKSGDPITKKCPECGLIVHPIVKKCPACEHEFQFEVKIKTTASEFDILKKTESQWVDVESVKFYKHNKRNSPNSVRVEYKCGLRVFKQWFAIESYSDQARAISKPLLKRFFHEGFDIEDFTVKNFLKHKQYMKTPKRIFVNTADKYPEVQSIEF